jgi:hypothetical protein
VYVEGTLYPFISLLQIGKDIMLYLSRMGGKLCLLVGVRTLPLFRSRHKNPLIQGWERIYAYL